MPDLGSVMVWCNFSMVGASYGPNPPLDPGQFSGMRRMYCILIFSSCMFLFVCPCVMAVLMATHEHFCVCDDGAGACVSTFFHSQLNHLLSQTCSHAVLAQSSAMNQAWDDAGRLYPLGCRQCRSRRFSSGCALISFWMHCLHASHP